MSTAQTFADTLLAPGRGLAGAASRRSFLPPIVAATLASLLVAFVVVPRLDYERAFEEQVERDPRAVERSPHDRETVLAQSRKLAAVLTYGGALARPALRVLAIACCVFVASRVAGGRPPFPSLLAVASWGSLPLGLRDLLSLPALLRMRGITMQDADRALPSSLAGLLPPETPPALAALAPAVDLFSLWAAGLVALGTAQAASLTTRRSAAVVLGLWCSYVLLAQLAVPNLLLGGAR